MEQQLPGALLFTHEGGKDRGDIMHPVLENPPQKKHYSTQILLLKIFYVLKRRTRNICFLTITIPVA